MDPKEFPKKNWNAAACPGGMGRNGGHQEEQGSKNKEDMRLKVFRVKIVIYFHDTSFELNLNGYIMWPSII